MGLSKLNLHRFRHNFKDTVNPMCPTNGVVEYTEHSLLRCHSFEVQPRSLFAGIPPLLRPLAFANISDEILVQLLLYDNCNPRVSRSCNPQAIIFAVWGYAGIVTSIPTRAGLCALLIQI